MTTMLRKAAGRLLAATILPARLAAAGRPRPAGIGERLAAFPTRDLPLESGATIHWNAHQVPFIEAASDRDLAFALGLVHAHLRLAQIEMFRRIARGRLAEVVGPVAVELDHALRLLGFGRAGEATLAAMSATAREWLESFVAGINHYLSRAPLPYEFAALRIPREPWSAGDVLALGRLAASDVNWLVWLRLLPLRGRADWPALWRAIAGGASGESAAARPHGGPARRAWFARCLSALRSGSNAVAVSAAKSAGGGALLAGDPHLGIQIPNLWLIAGYRSPSHHAVGLMLPGLPFIAVGRNPWIAWGGTNLHAESSALVDASDLPRESFIARRERIAVRWWRNREITLRETPFGPVVTDAKILRSGRKETLALRWLGHEPSDEIAAMLKLGQARNFAQFRAALEGFAVPGENMVYADTEGHVGKAMAVKLPLRRPPAADLVAAPAQARWDEFATGARLPSDFDPLQGFVVSANEEPPQSPVPISRFFSPGDRAGRLRALLAGKGRVSAADLAGVLADVFSPAAAALRDSLLGALPPCERLPPADRRLIEALRAWDGRYAAESEGALAFEVLFHSFTRRFFAPARLAAFNATWQARRFILRDIEAAAKTDVAAALARAIAPAARAFARYRSWGGMHRLRLSHPLALVLLVGRRYRFADRPAPGGGETILKTAHDGTARKHAARYGSSARYLVDLSDSDRNCFVLLGGQDGWIGSANFLDQLPLWEANRFVEVPLRPETVRARFPYRVELLPAGRLPRASASGTRDA